MLQFAPMAAALEARSLARAFRGRPVLRGASLAVAPGTVAAVVGENGSGKTTLLKILAGLLAPDAGDVRIAGRLGYCPQDADLFETLTIREHFRLFAGALGVRRWQAELDRLAGRLAFRAHAGALVRELSGGVRQKLNLSLALLGDPEVVLLDEPCAAFDWQTYLAFWELAGELRARGRAVLLVSHLVHDRERLDAIWELAEGVLRCG
jgi:ABC-type multidrug transport system ATPase subunit